MNRSIGKCFLLLSESLVMALLGCQSNISSTNSVRSSYDSFPGTYTLTNGNVVVVVAPQVGRIVGYHRVGEPNLLWINTNSTPAQEAYDGDGPKWMNYGGDKIWLAPQNVWCDTIGRKWPPETTTDGDPWTVTYATSRKLIMISGISPAHGARVTRTITLPDDTTTVRIDHHLERTKDDRYPVLIWPITQVCMPEYALLDLTQDRPNGKGIMSKVKYGIKLDQNFAIGAARFDWPLKGSSKVGTYGQWVAAVYGHRIFAQYASLDLTGEYSDNANCQVYVYPKERYLELELLSPTKYLSAGETLDFTVTWKILAPSPAASQDDIIKCIESNIPVSMRLNPRM